MPISLNAARALDSRRRAPEFEIKRTVRRAKIDRVIRYARGIDFTRGKHSILKVDFIRLISVIFDCTYVRPDAPDRFIRFQSSSALFLSPSSLFLCVSLFLLSFSLSVISSSAVFLSFYLSFRAFSHAFSDCASNLKL